MRSVWGNVGGLWIVLLLFALLQTADAQTLIPTPAPSPSGSPEEETIVPTFETQKLARTFMLDIPAPRPHLRTAILTSRPGDPSELAAGRAQGRSASAASPAWRDRWASVETVFQFRVVPGTPSFLSKKALLSFEVP